MRKSRQPGPPYRRAWLLPRFARNGERECLGPSACFGQRGIEWQQPPDFRLSLDGVEACA